MRKALTVALTFTLAAIARLAHAAPDCTTDELEVIRQAATADDREVRVACNVRLEPGDVVTKRLLVEGDVSDLTIDCNDALLDGDDGKVNAGKDMIEVRSVESGTTWLRPLDVTIKNCRIAGSVRIYGMGRNGEADLVRDSSHEPGHVARLRAAAPSRITFDNLHVNATGRTPFYVAPGVTYVTLTHSYFEGHASRTAIYLDTESAYNTIRNSYVHVSIGDLIITGPQVNIDNSSYNRIFNNRFSALTGGGIFLYRNCGEGGTVRTGTPRSNQIINNVFYYDSYDGGNPSVFLGSRGDDWWRGYCDDDSAYPWGSGLDNRSFARYNVVMQNQIYRLPTGQMIRQGDSTNQPNYVDHNETVTSAVSRLAGCYVASGYKDFIRHGETIDVFRGTNDLPTCTGYSATCNDNTLTYRSGASCTLQRPPFACQASGTNSGCNQLSFCPPGTRIVGVRAACNLEYGTVSDAELASVPGYDLEVVRASDNVADGRCYVGNVAAQSGAADLADLVDIAGVGFGCRENDANGGDCHVRGELFCR